MRSRCGVVRHLLAGLVFGGVLGSWAWAQTGGASIMTASPPQQMLPYGSSGTPATYPSTSYPSTSYSSPSYTTGPMATGVADYGTYGSVGTQDEPSALPYPSKSGAETVPMPDVRPDGSVAPAKPGPIYTPYGGPDAMTASLAASSESQAERLLSGDEPMSWQLAPTGLMYKSYLAGEREPRMGSELSHERVHGWYWQATVGGRVGLLRYGTDNSLWPQGWQLDVEGAAFPRLDLEHEEDLVDCDYRGGLLSTTRQGPLETKFGYYHLSSHIGDEYLLRYPTFPRINYVRDSLIAGAAVYLNPSLRLYGEVGWCFREDGGAKPWEFQFGADFSSPEPTGVSGAPFFAINAHLRQENNFGGNLSVQTGWQWRGRDGHLARVGMHYFNGMSDHYQFYNMFEEYIGFGLWYDY
jgi:hypothetical protein